MVMFLLSTAFWIAKILAFIQMISYDLPQGQPPTATDSPVNHSTVILAALALVNVSSPSFDRLLYLHDNFLEFIVHTH